VTGKTCRCEKSKLIIKGMTDYIADMLIRIKNGQKAHLNEIVLHNIVPKKCISILNILEKEGYISG
jgi:ribosomal protein S8